MPGFVLRAMVAVSREKRLGASYFKRSPRLLRWVMTVMAYSRAISFLTALTMGEDSGRASACDPASGVMVD